MKQKITSFLFFMIILFITSCNSNKNITKCPDFKQSKESISIVRNGKKNIKKKTKDINQKITTKSLEKVIHKIDKKIISNLNHTEFSLQFEERDMIINTFAEIKKLKKSNSFDKDEENQNIVQNIADIKEIKNYDNINNSLDKSDAFINQYRSNQQNTEIIQSKKERSHLNKTAKKMEWRAIVSLILGLVGIFITLIAPSLILSLIGILLCIIAIIFGIRAIKNIKNSNNLKGRGIAIISVGITVRQLLLFLLGLIVIIIFNN